MFKEINLTTNSSTISQIILGSDIFFTLPCYLELLDASNIVIITDHNVYNIYKYDIKKIFDNSKLNYSVFLLESGENTKNINIVNEFIDHASKCDFNLDRNTILIALGGGVIGDIAGFIANIFYRGLKLVSIPTTLLAQTDSSIGGKNAINTVLGKNTIGTIYQPNLVFIDINFLNSLPEREYLSAWSEIIKYAVLFSNSFLKNIIGNIDKILVRDKSFIQNIIEQSIIFKSRIIKIDEKDNNIRKLLNLGHSLGHAIEKFLGDKNIKILHGEAVAFGLIFILDLSINLGYSLKIEKKMIKEFFDNICINTDLFNIINHSDVDKILEIMERDKKNYKGLYNLVIIEKIEQCKVISIKREIILSTINNLIAA